MWTFDKTTCQAHSYSLHFSFLCMKYFIRKNCKGTWKFKSLLQKDDANLCWANADMNLQADLVLLCFEDAVFLTNWTFGATLHQARRLSALFFLKHLLTSCLCVTYLVILAIFQTFSLWFDLWWYLWSVMLLLWLAEGSEDGDLS